MRSVTEFHSFALAQGNKAKAALAAEGKSPEEISASLATTFKLEGDKLKYFTNALEVASQNADGLKRVIVAALAEGENAPAKATQVEEMVYIPEFLIDPKKNPPAAAADGRGGKGGRRGGRGGDRGPKESPWGLSPEQKAAKKGKAAAKTEDKK